MPALPAPNGGKACQTGSEKFIQIKQLILTLIYYRKPRSIERMVLSKQGEAIFFTARQHDLN